MDSLIHMIIKDGWTKFIKKKKDRLIENIKTELQQKKYKKINLFL